VWKREKEKTNQLPWQLIWIGFWLPLSRIQPVRSVRRRRR